MRRAPAAGAPGRAVDVYPMMIEVLGIRDGESGLSGPLLDILEPDD